MCKCKVCRLAFKQQSSQLVMLTKEIVYNIYIYYNIELLFIFVWI